jgi:hypothetical protein
MAGAGLQEFVGMHDLPLYRQMVKKRIILGMKRPAFRHFDGQWLVTTSAARGSVNGYSLDKLRYALALDDESDEFDEAVNDARVEVARFREVINRATRFVDRDFLDPTVFVSPKLWTPNEQRKEKELIQRAALPLIQALQSERRELGSLHWRQLEDVVAEVLRGAGMEVHEARDSPQGGRDILARIQIAPGEILSVAVEVKHQKVVDRPELQTALYQNSHFPALMLVTSGRFSAGAILEARKPENRMRVFLRDGVAIRDLLRAYPLQTVKR